MADRLVPLYVVACTLTPEPDTGTEPVVFLQSMPDPSLSLDIELVPALPALWYAMHLPRHRWDTLDLPLQAIRDYLNESLPHALTLIPTALLHDSDAMDTLVRGYEPILILCPQGDLADAETVAAACGFVIPPVSFASLSQETLASHWELLEKLWPGHGRPGGRFGAMRQRQS